MSDQHRWVLAQAHQFEVVPSTRFSTPSPTFATALACACCSQAHAPACGSFQLTQMLRASKGLVNLLLSGTPRSLQQHELRSTSRRPLPLAQAVAQAGCFLREVLALLVICVPKLIQAPGVVGSKQTYTNAPLALAVAPAWFKAQIGYICPFY